MQDESEYSNQGNVVKTRGGPETRTGINENRILMIPARGVCEIGDASLTVAREPKTGAQLQPNRLTTTWQTRLPAVE
jgi:hypothetical protein